MEKKTAFPSEFQKRTMWRALTGLAILVIGSLLVGLVWLVSSVLGYLQPVLVPVAVAGIIAYLLEPVVKWLQRTRKLTRLRAIIAVFCGFVLVFGTLFAFVGSELSNQFGEATGEKKNSLISDIDPASLAREKENSSWGWIVKSFFKKDYDAFDEVIEKQKTIIGPDKKKWRYDRKLDRFVHNIPPKKKPIPAETPPAPENSSASEVSDTLKPPVIDTLIEEASPAMENLFLSDWTENIVLDGNEHAEDGIALENFTLTRGGNYLTKVGQQAVPWLFSSSGKILGVLGVILGFAMVPIYLYFFLVDSESIQATWQNYIPLKASQFKDEVVDTLREINGYLISFFRGQVLVAFIDGVLVGLALFIFGLKYGLLIGFFMAILGVIPYIGNILCLIPACIIAYFQSSDSPVWGLPPGGYVLGVVLIFIIVQQINSLVTAPKIVGDSVGLHPMTVIFSMLFWSLILGGFLGALLAVPLTAAIKVLFRRYVWEKQDFAADDVSESPA